MKLAIWSECLGRLSEALCCSITVPVPIHHTALTLSHWTPQKSCSASDHVLKEAVHMWLATWLKTFFSESIQKFVQCWTKQGDCVEK
jgi:hypothetical protein